MARDPSMHLDFVIPGFSKCGTSSLCDMLAGHPDIFIPEVKEPCFFLSPAIAENTPWYEALFAPGVGKRLWGEGSTFYSSASLEVGARERMLALYPDVRLIFVARDPLDRLESSFREFHSNGALYGIAAPFSFKEALVAIPNLIEDTSYWTRLQNYRRHMPDENIQVIFFEDLVSDPRGTLATSLKFLGARLDAIPATLPHLNAGETKLRDTPAMRWLRQHPRLGPLLGRMPLDRQDRLAVPLGLRRRFDDKDALIDRAAAHAYALDRLGDECRQLLAWCGKPLDFWPSLARASPQG
jgi:hypothetical protein